jgi:glutamate/tyrosine decarboxylase-like PLP-dependent enzyme
VLACGREHAIRTVLGEDYSVAEDGFGGVTITVFSDRAHCSLVKAAALVGIGRKNFVQLGSTRGEIEKQLQSCGSGTGRGAIVSLSFGEVNTVRPTSPFIPEKVAEVEQGEFTANVEMIRSVCDKYNVWLHIDAGRFLPTPKLSSSD